MGDHRASIKIQVEFHGIKKETDMWINWVQEMPTPVAEFFEEVYRLGLAEYHDKMDDYWAKQKEKDERMLLENLKKKYEANP